MMGCLDADSFEERVRALTTLGLDEDGIDKAFATLAAVLHLGAVRFVKEHKGAHKTPGLPSTHLQSIA